MLENLQDRNSIRDIAFDEKVPFFVEALKVIEISGIGEGVEIDHLARRKGFEKLSDEG
jgi:hypothetical protein